jgi:hypothetical protein
MIAWLLAWVKANKRVTVTVLLLVACWICSRIPGLEPERELFASIAAALGVFGTMFVPGFARPAPKEPPQ